MLRAHAVVSLFVVLSVAVGRCPAYEQDAGKGVAPGEEPRAWRRALPDDATLQRLLREAVGEVAAAQGDKLALQRSRTFEALAEAQEGVGDAEGARLSREQAAKTNVPIEGDQTWSLRERAYAFIRENKPEEAERVYEEMVRQALKRVAPDAKDATSDLFDVVISGTTIAEMLTRANKPESALRVLSRAREVVDAGSSYEPGFFVARQQAKAGDLAAARATLDAIQPRLEKNRDLKRRLYGYQAMVAARWALGDQEVARTLYKKASDLALAQPVTQYARENAMNYLPPMLAAMGDFEGAFRMAAEEAGALHESSRFSSVVQSIGRSAGLIQYADEARGYPPIDGEKAGEALRLAAKLAQAFKDESVRFVLENIVHLQASLGDLEGARQSYDALAAQGDGDDARSNRAWLLVDLAKAEWKSGKREAADADFAAALQIAESLPEQGERIDSARYPTISHPRDEAVGAVAVAQSELGDVEDALHTASRVRDPVRKAMTLTSAAEVRIEGDDRAGAARLAEAPGHGFPSIPYLVQIADADSRAGNRAAAEARLRSALKEAEDYLEHRPQDPSIPPYNPARVMTHWDRPPEGREREVLQLASAAFQVAELRAKLGDLPGALKALEMVENETWRESHLPGLLVRVLEAGDAQGAFERAIKISSPSQRLSMLFMLGEGVKRLKATPAR